MVLLGTKAQGLRASLKWGGTAVASLLIVVGLASAWREAFLELKLRAGVGAGAGQITVWWIYPASTPAWQLQVELLDNDDPLHWWFDHFTNRLGRGQMHVMLMPIWVLVACTIAPTTLVWLSEHRRPGRCANCGYDLRGNVSGTCPECGHDALLG